MTTQGVGIFAILVIVVFVLYGIGRTIRGRAQGLQIAAITGALLLVFLSIVLIASNFGIGVYEFYEFASCPESSPTCVTARQQEFNARVPALTVWMAIPKFLRPDCETVSPEFCTLEKTYEFSGISYIVGAFGTLIAFFFLLLGLRQKPKPALLLDKPLYP